MVSSKEQNKGTENAQIAKAGEKELSRNVRNGAYGKSENRLRQGEGEMDRRSNGALAEQEFRNGGISRSRKVRRDRRQEEQETAARAWQRVALVDREDKVVEAGLAREMCRANRHSRGKQESGE